MDIIRAVRRSMYEERILHDEALEDKQRLQGAEVLSKSQVAGRMRRTVRETLPATTRAGI